MKWRGGLSIGLTLLSLWGVLSPAVAKLSCPETPKQIQTDVVVETRGKLAAVGRLTGAELQNRTEVVAKSVLDKVPNADRLLAATMLTSLFCQILNDSALSDTEKLNRLDKFTERIDALINASSPRPPSRAPTQRNEGSIKPSQQPREQPPKLYYFDPEFNTHRELNTARVKLVLLPEGSQRCNVMHVWRTLPPTGAVDSFGLCGAWMKPGDEPTNSELYIAFSKPIKSRVGSCQVAPEAPEPKDTYVAGYVCRPGLSPSEDKWFLAPFFGESVPTEDTKVRFRLYLHKDGKKRLVEATFMILTWSP